MCISSTEMDDKIGDSMKSIGKAVGKMLVKKILLPLLPFIAIAMVFLLLLAMLVGAVYSAFPSSKTLAGATDQPERDAILQRDYIDLVDEYNVKDTWVVNSSVVTPGDGNAYESSPGNPFYPGQGVSNLGVLVDPYGRDDKLKLLWGQVHSATLYYAFVHQLDEIEKPLQEEVTDGMHPYFYYKKSQVIIVSCDEDGCVTEYDTQYLLVEAYTIQGHFQYSYEWLTTYLSNGGSITREVPKNTRQILPNKWQRLEDWIQEEYDLNDDSQDLFVARRAVWEAGFGFTEEKEWLEWLIANELADAFVSVTSIPAELMPLFKEAEERYGIPWWFLAAVAFKESSFNPLAENPGTKCYGLMQLMPANWIVYSQRLGFNPAVDRDNPRAQILTGAYMLYELGLKDVDWEADDWQEQTLYVLEYYGGFRGANATQRCLTQYAIPIWKVAEEFKNNTAGVWPTPGNNTITSRYGMRGSGMHKGIDIPLGMGDPVVSVSHGVITFTGWENPANHRQGWGQYVDVRDDRYTYRYAHLSQIKVQQGQTVRAGDLLGLGGSTGRSTGPHLHFEVLQGGYQIDPLSVFSDWGR